MSAFDKCTLEEVDDILGEHNDYAESQPIVNCDKDGALDQFWFSMGCI